jgi:hypothetical protein
MPRRLLAVALAGALALTGLTACQDQPTVAAYVGNAQLANADVEKAVSEFPAGTRDAHAGQIRQLVVSAFVTREVATKIAKDRQLTLQPADLIPYQRDASRLGISPTGGFIQLEAEATAAMKSIASLSQSHPPTDEDQRAVFAELVKAGAIQPGTPYSEVKAQLDSPELRAALGLRAVLADAVHADGVTVNPRYRPLGIYVPFTLANGQVQSGLSIPLDENASPAVVDAG